MATFKWEVTGGKQAGTVISQEGVLTVDASETPDTKLTIKASTDVDGKTITGEATATVTAP